MDAFLEYYLDNVNEIASATGFIGLTEAQLKESEAELDKLIKAQG
jgi:hypothetical protein